LKINSTDKICAFFLAWKFDPTFALSHDMPRGRFQLVKEDSKVAVDNLNGVLTNNDISMSSSAKTLSKQESFVKDWEVSLILAAQISPRLKRTVFS
jgi:hypothetical protein